MTGGSSTMAGGMPTDDLHSGEQPPNFQSERRCVRGSARG